MLRSDLCDHSDAYIVVKGKITVEDTNPVNRRNKKLTLKNNAQFRSYTSKINNTFIDNAEDVGIVILTNNLLEYRDNYSMASGSFWNYYRGKMNDNANETVANYRLNNSKTITSKSFEYKTKTIASTSDNDNKFDTEVVVPLKYLSNLWRSLNLVLINCEVELDLA